MPNLQLITRQLLRVLFSAAVSGSLFPAMAATSDYNLMPVPASCVPTEGALPVTAGFSVAYRGQQDARLTGATGRMLRRAEERTGFTFGRTPAGIYLPVADPGAASLVIECGAAGAAIPQLGEDESYTLTVSPTQALLRAPTALGAMHGLETVLQLLRSDETGWSIPAVTITDQPRFPWRGLLIDVGRHWQPMEVIKRNLDGMALVKLNVLHLHLTEDQGFRIESKKFPRLHELGSDGNYFTQNEMKEIIGYAAARGIRVMPEFDIPGHATSWLVGYPELASAPGPYVIQRKWGVFDPVLDPTNDKVYALLDGFLGEMAELFPDAYLHIGGDENNGKQWAANPAIQTFIKERGLKDGPGLHAYFNTQLRAILAKHGKKLIGWDEILHPDLPAGSVIHSWRGPDGIAAATQHGFATVLSNGYYIDLCQPTWKHYLNDPAPADAKLTDAQRQLIMGGEATMWAEWVTPETIDSRIWPRTAAIAERLWSPVQVRDVPDMYRRLAIVSLRLEEAGLHHESYVDPALRRLAGDGATVADLVALRRLVDLLEPVKGYTRGEQQPAATQFTPLNGLVDCVRPDSAACREFSTAMGEFIAAPQNAELASHVMVMLNSWQETADFLLQRLPALSPRLAEAQPMLRDLAAAAKAALFTCDALQEKKLFGPEAAKRVTADMAPVTKSRAAVEFPASADLMRLISAATEPASPAK